MAIDIWEVQEPKRFKSKRWVHSRTGDNKELITVNGIVLIDFKGEGGKWKRETLNLHIRFPDIIPEGKALKVENFAPFITINAIYNQDHAVNAGWAVDEFEGPGLILIPEKTGSITLKANVAISDKDCWLYRVGYSVTVKGSFINYEPPPIDEPQPIE